MSLAIFVLYSLRAHTRAPAPPSVWHQFDIVLMTLYHLWEHPICDNTVYLIHEALLIASSWAERQPICCSAHLGSGIPGARRSSPFNQSAFKHYARRDWARTYTQRQMHTQLTSITCSHTTRKTRHERQADLQDDPGLGGLLRAPHCDIPVTPVLTESSNAVVAVHVPANVPEDHIENEEYGEDEERD